MRIRGELADEALRHIDLKDEVGRIKGERQRLNEHVRRVGTTEASQFAPLETF